MNLSPKAKANLILDLGEKSSSGRYETHFVMQELSLSDGLGIELTAGGEIAIECDDAKVPTDSRNLCHKACEIMREKCGREEGVRIKITKRIPSAGGLGGGSSDAAAVICALNEVWKVGSSDDELIGAINSLLGTDASFFIKGKTAEVRDNGLHVRPIETNLVINYVFVLPDIKVSAKKTADLYASFDPAKVSVRPDVNGMVAALEENSLDGVAGNLFNAFEHCLPSAYSPVHAIKKELIAEGCINAIMCGAGPTVFGIARTRAEAEGIAAGLKGRHPMVFATHTGCI